MNPSELVRGEHLDLRLEAENLMQYVNGVKADRNGSFRFCRTSVAVECRYRVKECRYRVKQCLYRVKESVNQNHKLT